MLDSVLLIFIVPQWILELIAIYIAVI